MGETFWADCRFAGIPWFEGPEEGSTFPRTSHLDRGQRDSELSRLLAHLGEAAFVGICSATQYDRVARLAMEYGIGLSAACQEEYYDEHKTSRHVPSPSLAVRLFSGMRPLPRAESRWQREMNLIFDEPT